MKELLAKKSQQVSSLSVKSAHNENMDKGNLHSI